GAEFGDRGAGSQFAIAFDEFVAFDKGGEIGLIGDAEEDGQDAGEGRDDVEVLDAKDVEQREEGDDGEECGPAEIGGDQDRTAAETIDPGTGDEAEDEGGDEFGNADERDLERAGVEDKDGDERQSGPGDQRPEDGDRLRRPESDEVGVAPETGQSASHPG